MHPPRENRNGTVASPMECRIAQLTPQMTQRSAEQDAENSNCFFVNSNNNSNHCNAFTKAFLDLRTLRFFCVVGGGSWTAE
jgi:hypothetical protein